MRSAASELRSAGTRSSGGGAIVLVLVVALCRADIVSAQDLHGHVSVRVDVLPRVAVDGDTDERALTELRARVFVERRFEIGERLRLTAAGFADGLLADRVEGTVSRSGIVRPQELHAELTWAHADLRIGVSRVAWGRLDEVLPTDVTNPLDVAQFLFDGRSAARLPVAMVRGRLLPSDRFTLDAIYVPYFRRGRFDQLDESSSPFNLAPAGQVVRSDVPRAWRTGQGGMRASVTTGRVDWSVSAFRGIESLPVYELQPLTRPAAPQATSPTIAERFPRYTMLGGDFEAVRGPWGVRGEVAGFIDRALQAQVSGLPVALEGGTLEAGVGVDRRAGAYRVGAKLLVTTRLPEEDVNEPATTIDRRDILIISSVERSFARETRTLRGFVAANPGDGSAFVRVVTDLRLRDRLALELSGGVFVGSGADIFGRYATRDFVAAGVKVFF